MEIDHTKFVVKNPDNYLNEVLEFYRDEMHAQMEAQMQAEMEAYYAAEHRQFGYIVQTSNNPIK
jgi:hypothetical protein